MDGRCTVMPRRHRNTQFLEQCPGAQALVPPLPPPPLPPLAPFPSLDSQNINILLHCCLSRVRAEQGGRGSASIHHGPLSGPVFM